MTIPLSLHRARILESLSETEVEGLAALGEERSFSNGESLFREHEAADLLYILLEGRAKLSLRERGQTIELGRPTPGDHFGRMTLIEGQVCHTSAQGIGDGKLFVLSSMGCAALLARITRVRRPVPNITPAAGMQRPELIELEPSAPPPSSAENIRSLSSVVAGVAHEINTPLGVIGNAASFVTEQLENANWDRIQDAETRESLSDVAEACRLIQKNVAHASRLVQSFKKLSVGQLAEPRELVDLVRLIHETLNVFRAKTLSAVPPGPSYRGPRGQSGQHRLILASSRLDIQVECKLSESERLWDGFPGLFSRVLLNLLTNIDRYAYPGDAPGKVEIKLGRRSSPRGVLFELLVRDFGAGIAPADLPQIFDPFFTTGRDRGGTGLGLSMVHNLMTQGFNGSVRVQSVVGKGTTFDLSFPERAPDHAALMNSEASPESRQSAPNARGT